MKKLFTLFVFLGLSLGTTVLAAPQYTLQRTILPETDNLYDFGTTTPTSLQWRNIYAKALYINGVAATSTNYWYANGNDIYSGNSGNVGIGLTNPGSKFQVNGGHFTFGTDNTYDIGASGATRPRTLYLGTSLDVGGGNATISSSGAMSINSTFTLPSTGTIAWGSGATFGDWKGITDGIWQYRSSAGNGFRINAITTSGTMQVLAVGGGDTAIVKSNAFTATANVLVASGNGGFQAVDGGVLLGQSQRLRWTSGSEQGTVDLQVSRVSARVWQLGPTTGAQMSWATDGTVQFLAIGGGDTAVVKSNQFWATGKIGVATSTPWAQLSVGAHNIALTTPLFVVASSSDAVATTTHFIVTGAGNVGVGTAAPGAKFEVAGTIKSNYNSGSSGDIKLGEAASSQNATITYSASGNNSLSIATNFVNASNYISLNPGAAEAIRVLGSGLVGIGTTTPSANLSVQTGSSSGNAFVVATSTGNQIGGYDNDGHRFSSGPAPAISVCGTGTGTVVGDDQSGTITTATAATACTATFSKAYKSTPVCTVTDDSLVGFADISAVSTTAVTFGISSALTGGKLYYQCLYHQ